MLKFLERVSEIKLASSGNLGGDDREENQVSRSVAL